MQAVKVFAVLLSAFLAFSARAGAETKFESSLNEFLWNHWEAHPFWEKAEKDALLEKGRILVSALNHDRRSWMKGAGNVKVPIDRAFRFAQDYSRLERMTKYFSEVHFEPSTHLLSLKADFPFRSAEKVEIRVTSLEEGSRKALLFEMLKGFSQGTRGVLLFEDLKRQAPSCRISLQALTLEEQQYSWITQVGIEVVLKAVASSLRDTLEKEKP